MSDPYESWQEEKCSAWLYRIVADCERGMGRPERALELTVSDEARRLDFDGQVEMLIVAAGARTDLGQLDAAVVTLQVPELTSKTKATWLARLRSAYADPPAGDVFATPARRELTFRSNLNPVRHSIAFPMASRPPISRPRQFAPASSVPAPHRPTSRQSSLRNSR